MKTQSIKYVVITPVRDEEEHIQSTIQSMIHQTVLPQEWVIVDDGSKDGTGRIIDDYASRYPWIRAVHRKDRGFRKAGGGVVDAFNDGYRVLTCSDWGFMTKFDGDLAFDPDYFEKCFDEFYRDDKLGVGGGVICYVAEGKKRFEEAPAFHVRGATKIYRKACWDGIGGFLARARLGHDGRGEGQQPRVDDTQLSTTPSYSSQKHRISGWTLAHSGQVWPRELYMWLSPFVHVEQMHGALLSQAVRCRFHRVDVRICLRISNQRSTSR